MNYLLDTCVLSEIRKRKPDQNVMDWIGQIDESRLFLSVITFGEIRKGIAKIADKAQKLALQNWLKQDLRDRFSQRILSVDLETALEWGILQGEGFGKGQPKPVIDCLIAATAIQHDLTLVTRNVTDFAHFPVELLNPWEKLS